MSCWRKMPASSKVIIANPHTKVKCFLARTNNYIYGGYILPMLQKFVYFSHFIWKRCSHSAINSGRNFGWAMEINRRPRSRSVWLRSLAILYSVTIYSTSLWLVVTTAPSSSTGTIFELFPPCAVEAMAIMDTPPFDIRAPRTKSTCPPTAEICFSPMLSAQTCPCKSTYIQDT